MSIELRNITKNFGAYQALHDVNVEVKDGELLALLGPSGCGKTTLLRVIAGLEKPDSGSVHLDGRDSTRETAKEKQVGFVFQHYALFPHMSVFDNVAFGMQVQARSTRPSRQAIKDRVHELLTMVQMEWSSARLPSQLSGGQRQRIALARALAVKPRVLLLDEPFSALDAKVRLDLRRWLRKLHDELHVTSVFVTHDQEEALELADRVVIINQGKVEQSGTPDEVYDNPANAFVYNFLGNVNVFHGRVDKGQFSLGGVPLTVPTADHLDENRQTQAFVRPHEIEVATTNLGPDFLETTILAFRIQGGIIGLELERSDGQGSVEAEIPREEFRSLGLERGSRVWVRVKNARFFQADDYQI